jgi:hypothetical protein
MLAAEAPVHVAGWTVRQVNQETRNVAPGATLPLCQAIPLTAITARLRTADPGRRVRVRLRAPGRPAAVRLVRLQRRTRVTFTPADVHLRDFVEGTYRLTVRCAGHALDRATLRLAGGGTC